ncbi:MAG: ArsR family transcriptional regulator [Acidobacteria bacterium]|nr:MAG: ArsR family transcriptional regulator [Acidobacteriota bacterium]REK02903.1 MAG: ArsR family transcriptional regulator [Acidobacteriota bacterium]REK13293.1 MAG: ArsR family transcriptional regulator [Acidobacteriota bacterium]REK41287.1 MAG: ArsR family transcriptional regulator [Acidobacteriota bacterium]
MKAEEQLAEMSELFTALADRTRLRILNLLREDEICVCFFSEALNESQPKISRHLAYLRKSGLVDSRRDGKWMHYSLVVPEEPAKAAVLRTTLEWLWDRDEMRADYKNLEQVCCAVDVPVTIAKAPKPEAIVERESVPAEPLFEAEELETYLL